MEYIDVRGVWPLYFNGMNATELVNARRGISLELARRYTKAENFLRQLGAADFIPAAEMFYAEPTDHQDEA